MCSDLHGYHEIPPCSREQAQEALVRNDCDALARVVIAVSLHDPDERFAEELRIRLSGHEHEMVRGNSVLGLGHVARRFGTLDTLRSKPIIEAALKDQSEYVRGQAWAAR